MYIVKCTCCYSFGMQHRIKNIHLACGFESNASLKETVGRLALAETQSDFKRLGGVWRISRWRCAQRLISLNNFVHRDWNSLNNSQHSLITFNTLTRFCQHPNYCSCFPIFSIICVSWELSLEIVEFCFACDKLLVCVCTTRVFVVSRLLVCYVNRNSMVCWVLTCDKLSTSCHFRVT